MADQSGTISDDHTFWPSAPAVDTTFTVNGAVADRHGPVLHVPVTVRTGEPDDLRMHTLRICDSGSFKSCVVEQTDDSYCPGWWWSHRWVIPQHIQRPAWHGLVSGRIV